ncbi:unnamed protein product [Cylicostephanus goldi]|uniref:Uncharacterized protein n=1 Tax=Cylicostephanus goldi TaxID=71465 RepID=A0A3P6RU43_CYLGO|nr:unnamed protein product [Cylicostephanus goldi]
MGPPCDLIVAKAGARFHPQASKVLNVVLIFAPTSCTTRRSSKNGFWQRGLANPKLRNHGTESPTVCSKRY